VVGDAVGDTVGDVVGDGVTTFWVVAIVGGCAPVNLLPMLDPMAVSAANWAAA
jgi:hypothetical protein